MIRSTLFMKGNKMFTQLLTLHSTLFPPTQTLSSITIIKWCEFTWIVFPLWLLGSMLLTIHHHLDVHIYQSGPTNPMHTFHQGTLARAVFHNHNTVKHYIYRSITQELYLILRALKGKLIPIKYSPILDLIPSWSRKLLSDGVIHTHIYWQLAVTGYYPFLYF